MKKFLLMMLLCTWGIGFAAAQNDATSAANLTEVQVEQPAGEHVEPGAHAEHAELGRELPLWTGLPFLGILLSIALCPLLAPHFWHHHFGKVSTFWGLLFAIPFVLYYGGAGVYEIMHIYILDYIPFIILLWSLYTVAGGVLLSGTLIGTPAMNTILLFIGTLLASWMGTTGAAMLMIRPFLRANKHRKNRTFMVCFFIFLVANIGGALTPLGDPPLFLGFLHGVPFFWTLNIFPHMMLCVFILLVVYFLLDRHYFKFEEIVPEIEERSPLRISGSYNFLLLGGVVAAVLMSGTIKLSEINLFGIHRPLQDYLRDIILIGIGIASLKMTPWSLREENGFTWAAIQEVAILFAGIFVTMVPCLAILKAGEAGAAAALFGVVKEPVHYYFVSGILSSFLDNAPTYLTFFTTALGKFYPGMPEKEALTLLMQQNPNYLAAISAGSVFFGAMTYIGNAPNFMVRSIAEEAGTPMPSFFGYMLKYSIVFLLPVFILVAFLFFL